MQRSLNINAKNKWVFFGAKESYIQLIYNKLFTRKITNFNKCWTNMEISFIEQNISKISKLWSRALT